MNHNKNILDEQIDKLMEENKAEPPKTEKERRFDAGCLLSVMIVVSIVVSMIMTILNLFN